MEKKENNVEEKTLDLNILINRAQIAEQNKKFLIACNHYSNMFSRLYNKISSDESLLKSLTISFVFNITLLSPGILKERFLNNLLQNDNITIFDFKQILEKMLSYQLVFEEDLNKLLSVLPSTLSCFASAENNLFEKAMFEHNIYSISRVYENIDLTTLTKFLKCTTEKVINYIFKMILEKKINAKIDEANEYIYFISEHEHSLNFDKQIQNFCLKVMNLSRYIQSKN